MTAGTVYVSTSRGIPAQRVLPAAAAVCVLAAVASGPVTAGFGPIFDAGFVVACLGTVLTVQRRWLVAALVAPPLLYALGAVTNGIIGGATGPGSWVLRQGANLAADLVVGAPVLVAVLAVVTVLAVLRGRALSAPRRPAAGVAPAAARTSGSPPPRPLPRRW